MGVRSDGAAARDHLRAVFAGAVVADPTVGPDYSVALALDAGARGPRVLARLQHGDRVVARSRSPRRILRALAAHLAVHDHQDRQDVLELGAVGLVKDGLGALAPRDVVHGVAGHERRLAEAGIAVVEGPLALVDPTGSELVVEAPVAAFDPEALAAVADPVADRLPIAPAGRCRLVGCALGNFPFTPDVSTPARRALALVGLTRNLGAFGGQRGLDLVGRMATTLPTVTVDQSQANAALRTVIDLLA